MEIRIDITEEALLTALNTVGEVLVSNAKESLFGTGINATKAGYTILRDGTEITPTEIKKQRGKKHTQAEYKLIITIEA